jgi:hypothetical protein
MHIRTTRLQTALAIGAAAAVGCGGLVVATAADASTTVPTVNVTITDNSLTLSGAGATTSGGVTTLRAGHYRFHITSPKGDHALQLFYFHNGYTPQQFQQDGDKGFNGDVPAVQRIDHGVVFRGGADAPAGHPADVVIGLSSGSYYAADLNGNARRQLNITGKAPSQTSPKPTSTFTAYSYGWTATGALHAKGWVTFVNSADQPHFLVLQHVKQSTTNDQVKKFIASGSQSNPPWALKEGYQAGVVSPGHSQLSKLDLPAGKYIVMCFWPDYFTGMPHVNMGMWRLIQLH